jgi:hypothetical protein
VRKIPAGHVETDGRLEATPAVERARALRAAGASCQRIADALTDEHYPCAGARWHLTTVRRMLQRAGAL